MLSFFGIHDLIQCKFIYFWWILKDRGIYSVLGASAVAGSVTRTVSVVMIVIELNGHLSHAVPLMICVLCSYATSEYLKPESFFEMLANFTELDK